MAKFVWMLFVTGGLVACNGGKTNETGDTSTTQDVDGDGLSGEADCDDSDALIGGPTDWFTDADGDGFGDAAATAVLACEQELGTSADNTDCDDSDASINPETSWLVDGDGDGFGAGEAIIQCEAPEGGVLEVSEDCDDTNADIKPGIIETCGTLGVDDNCDGLIDEADPTLADAVTFYEDVDSDTYGDPLLTVSACAAPPGYVATAGDCNDDDALYNPAAAESCSDPNDYNCDGSTTFADVDGDGFAACIECNDTDPSVFPGASEVCNGVDDNCDGLTDDESATDASTFYVDADGDGAGSIAVSVIACYAPDNYVSSSDDCNDAQPAMFPGNIEICDSLDNDCNGTSDDAAVDAPTFYRDVDADGYGLTADTTRSCSVPSGYATLSGDCNDASTSVNPGMTEVCDATNIDENCNSLSDDFDPTVSPLGRNTYFLDNDLDTYGSTTSAIYCDPPSNYVRNNTDCDDTVALVNPGRTEVCDNFLDDDCSTGTNAACYFSSAISATATDWRLLGDTAGGQLASRLAPISDVNGDSRDDVLIASTQVSSARGRVYLVPSSVLTGANVASARTTFTWGTTGAASEGFGTGLASISDVSADGVADVLIGAPYNDAAATDAGALYVVSGALTGTQDLAVGTIYRTRWTGAAANHQAGFAVTSINDVSSDGLRDIAFSAIRQSTGSGIEGAVYVVASSLTGNQALSSSASYLRKWEGVSSPALPNQTGNALASAGDVDGDGVEELIIGARQWDTAKGRAYLISTTTASGALQSVADTRINGTVNNMYVGSSVAGIGDINGDDLSDVLVGAPSSTASEPGNAYVILGTSATRSSVSLAAASTEYAAKIVGVAAGDGLGGSVAGVGDVNGDGPTDFTVGAAAADPSALTNAGSVYLFYGGAGITGTITASSASVVFTGGAAGDAFGTAAAGPIDANNDGFDDVLVGAISAKNVAAASVGAAYLFYGGGI